MKLFLVLLMISSSVFAWPWGRRCAQKKLDATLREVGQVCRAQADFYADQHKVDCVVKGPTLSGCKARCYSGDTKHASLQITVEASCISRKVNFVRTRATLL